MSEETNLYDQPDGPEDIRQEYPELSAEPIDKRPIIYGTLTGLAIIIIFVGIGTWLFLHPVATSILRDIFIIYMGLGAFVIILLLIALIVIIAYLVIKINDLIQLLDREIKPMLANIQDTTGTVRGTATFLGDYAVKPVMSTVSSIAAVKAVFRSLFRR